MLISFVAEVASAGTFQTQLVDNLSFNDLKT